jgi:ABC-2 type transport system ATP-binding protein
MQALVELTGLRKAFRGHLGIGRTVAVDGLDLQVPSGEILGLIGPNGAGKTTTLKMMLGLLRPDEGSVRLFGRPPQDVAARARLGYLPENPYFYDYLTPVEFLDFYGRLHGLAAADRKRRIESAIARVGLSGRERTPLRKFSKGMIQRLGLAQAIQHDPELLILDEPMSGLDPVGRREVRDLILAQRAAGRTVFFSSHILQDAEMVCDRVAIVFKGKLLAVGKLDELVSRTAKWIEVSVRGTLPGGIPGEATATPDGTTLVKVDGIASLTHLLTALAGSGAEVVSVWPRRESLEDLFLREIGRAKASEPAS